MIELILFSIFSMKGKRRVRERSCLLIWRVPVLWVISVLWVIRRSIVLKLPIILFLLIL